MRKETKASKSKGKAKQKTKNKNVKKQNTKKEKGKQAKQEQQVIQEKKQIQIPYTLSDEGLKIKIQLHKKYELDKQSQLAGKIKNLFKLYLQKQKRKNPKLYNTVKFSYFPIFEYELMGEKPQEEKCSICQFEYQSVSDEQVEKQLINESQSDLIALNCSHVMHYQCFKVLLGDKEWIRCPVCFTIFGKMQGDQPPGAMHSNINNTMHCEGYPDCGTICISYNMHAGKRGNISFPGTSRHAYLPDNKQGNEVFKLLTQAFNRKLIFTIGTSVTTGRENQIVWNGIHHKTNLSGGSAYFGYPDPTYFDRVKLELAAKGIS